MSLTQSLVRAFLESEHITIQQNVHTSNLSLVWITFISRKYETYIFMQTTIFVDCACAFLFFVSNNLNVHRVDMIHLFIFLSRKLIDVSIG